MKYTPTPFSIVLSKAVTGLAYAATAALVIYMVGSFTAAMYVFAQNWHTLFFAITDPGQAGIEFQYHILGTLAFFLVLFKAFKIFQSYAETQHINVKLIIEIAIIASIIELLFNIHHLTTTIAVILGFFTVSMSAVYLHYYETLKLVGSDFEERHK